MVKYFEELEHDFTILGTQKVNMPRKTNKMDFEYLKKSLIIHNLLDEIEKFLLEINIKEVEILFETSDYNYYDEFEDFKNFKRKNLFILNNDIIEKHSDFASIIRDYIGYIKMLNNIKMPGIYKLYPKLEILYEFLYQKETSFILEKPIHHYVSYKFNYNWFITPFNDLYHPGQDMPHKEMNLQYRFDHIKRCLNFKSQHNELIGKSEQLLKDKRQIEKQKYITLMQYYNYYKVTSLPLGMDKYNVYDEKIVTIVKGVISAQAALYRFFENIVKYSDFPKIEYQRLWAMCYNDKVDLLVLALGFHKIESMVSKTITTASITPYQDFSEYIKRGWNVNYLPPLVIDRNTRRIQRLKIDQFSYAGKIIEKDKELYELDKLIHEKTKTLSFGELY